MGGITGWVARRTFGPAGFLDYVTRTIERNRYFRGALRPVRLNSSSLVLSI